MPPKVVFTPDELFTAVLVNEPVIGIERTNDPIKLPIPNAINSCVASNVRPLALHKNYNYV